MASLQWTSRSSKVKCEFFGHLFVQLRDIRAGNDARESEKSIYLYFATYSTYLPIFCIISLTLRGTYRSMSSVSGLAQVSHDPGRETPVTHLMCIGLLCQHNVDTCKFSPYNEMTRIPS